MSESIEKIIVQNNSFKFMTDYTIDFLGASTLDL
jgi:hypothetical protein